MRTCSLDGCDRAHEARGYCRMHYRRWAKHGDTDVRKAGKPYTGRSVEQVRRRIADSVVVASSGCWEWRRGRSQAGGYGLLTWLGIVGAHRVSYAVYIGPIPSGMFVCHRCDNPPCCNPEHLFLGTPDDNQADMTTKGRARRAFVEHRRGEAHPAARITAEIAAEIRASVESGAELARRFGISQQLVCDIRKGRRWAVV